MSQEDYMDDYHTCARTYATFVLNCGDIDPATVTELLGMKPTRTSRKGEPYTISGDLIAVSTWQLSSRSSVDSKDLRRHIDWVLDTIGERSGAIRLLQAQGCRADMWCYWLSHSGQGGPTISVSQMQKLANAGFDLLFDLYLDCEQEEVEGEKE